MVLSYLYVERLGCTCIIHAFPSVPITIPVPVPIPIHITMPALSIISNPYTLLVVGPPMVPTPIPITMRVLVDVDTPQIATVRGALTCPALVNSWMLQHKTIKTSPRL
jgi:hypothetical protein